MNYKALVCDIDGTLVANRLTALPSQVTIDALGKASKFLKVCVATGRPIQMAEEIISKLALTGPCIFANGAVIYDPVKKTVLKEHCLTNEEIMDLVPLLKELGIAVYIRDINGRYELTKNAHPDHAIYMYIPPINQKALEVLEAYVRARPDLTLQKMIAWEKGKIDYTITRSVATKQHAILEVATIMNIETHEIIAIGDGYNDFPLLMACGFKVAMGNAVPDIKAIADYIAPTVEEDGVSDVISKFILRNK